MQCGLVFQNEQSWALQAGSSKITFPKGGAKLLS